MSRLLRATVKIYIDVKDENDKIDATYSKLWRFK